MIFEKWDEMKKISPGQIFANKSVTFPKFVMSGKWLV